MIKPAQSKVVNFISSNQEQEVLAANNSSSNVVVTIKGQSSLMSNKLLGKSHISQLRHKKVENPIQEEEKHEDSDNAESLKRPKPVKAHKKPPRKPVEQVNESLSP